VGPEGGVDGQLLYSADGAVVALLTPKQIQIVDSNTLETKTTIVSQ
jgi:hypothetical protein